MSDPVVIAIIASIGPTAIGLGTLISSIINRRKIEEHQKTVNSRLDQLIEAKEAAARAQGMKEQQDLNSKKP